MPELPEVETIRRSLEPFILGRTIQSVAVHLSKTVTGLSPDAFIRTLTGKKVLALGRRGKYLLITLSEGWTLRVHLRMTGHFICTSTPAVAGPHTRVEFFLDNGCHLVFDDQRTFGTMTLAQNGCFDPSGFDHLGPEPLSEAFTPEHLIRVAGKRHAPIKSILLNQALIAGVGNIYADESLFLAGIAPSRPASSLTLHEWAALHQAINQVIQDGIRHRGTSIQSYMDADGRTGTYQDHLSVYQRDGHPCPRCHTPVIRIVIAGRGTHFCPQCQR